MVVIIDRTEYMDWLTCSVDDAPRYFRQWRGEVLAEPARLDRDRPAKPEPPQSAGELF